MVISKHNIHPNAISKITIGMNYKEIVSYFGPPLIENHLQDNEGLVAMYTSDRLDGDMFYCRDLYIIFKNSNEGLVIKDYSYGKNIQSSQKRCDNYAYSASQNNIAWSEFFKDASDSLNSIDTQREISSTPEFCYYSDYGTKEICYLSLSSCRDRISNSKSGYCQIEH